MRPLPGIKYHGTPIKKLLLVVSGEAAMVMGALISCIKRRKQKDIHSKSNDAITIYVGNLGS